jgi:hypothetical protein
MVRMIRLRPLPDVFPIASGQATWSGLFRCRSVRVVSHAPVALTEVLAIVPDIEGRMQQ